MASTVTERFRRVFSAFAQNEDASEFHQPDLGSFGVAHGTRPDRVRVYSSNDRSIITSVYTRISIDVASILIKHVRLDDDGRYLEDIKSGLNDCLTVEANIDQAAEAFRQDIAMTLCDKGVAAIVPIETSEDTRTSVSFDIFNMRVGEVVKWHPEHVTVSVYNEKKGKREEITLPKRVVAIVENPLYAIMNEPNSTLQRLIRKLNLLDTVDEQSASGKLDLIVQLPYTIKSDARRIQAQSRRDDIEFQLKGSKYGIAYMDATEKITQLNRPAENNLLAQIESLTTGLYGQLGITKGVMDGTADEKEMLNYLNRTVKPILNAIVENMRRRFLTKTARSQKQSIVYFTDPFKLVPMEKLAEIADKFTRNEIATSNEFRQIVGMKPSKDPKADQLVNSNMPQGTIPEIVDAEIVEDDDPELEMEKVMNDALDAVNAEIDSLFKDLGEEVGDA